jgi:hypothetical protein
MANTAVRGVTRSTARFGTRCRTRDGWLSVEDFMERRRVAFIGARLREKAFRGTAGDRRGDRIAGVALHGRRHHGPEDAALSNYFTSDDEECALSLFLGRRSSGTIRYANVLVFSA